MQKNTIVFEGLIFESSRNMSSYKKMERASLKGYLRISPVKIHYTVVIPHPRPACSPSPSFGVISEHTYSRTHITNSKTELAFLSKAYTLHMHVHVHNIYNPSLPP